MDPTSIFFPLEVHYAVLDELQHEHATLSACSGVSKAFWLYCRRHIFAEVKVPEAGLFADSQQYLERLFKLMTDKKYAIGHFIQRFQVNNLKYEDVNSSIFASILEELIRHKRLKCIDIHRQAVWIPYYAQKYRWHSIDARVREALQTLLSSSHLEEWRFDQIDIIPLTMFNGSKIQHLSLGDARPENHETYLGSLPSPPPLESLRIQHFLPVIDVGRPIKSFFRLSTLEITCHGYMDFSPSIQAVFDQSRDSLQYLAILRAPEGQHLPSQIFDLSRFNKLRYFKACSNGLYPIASITRLLQCSSPLPSLEELEVEVDITGKGLPPGTLLSYSTDGVDFLFGWLQGDCAKLDEMLVHDHLRCIVKIKIRFLVEYRESQQLNIGEQLGAELRQLIPTQLPLICAVREKKLDIEIIEVKDQKW